MTIQDTIDWFSANQYVTLGYFIGLLLLTLLLVSIVNQNNFAQIKYLLSIIVYAVTIPGMLASILILYSFFILNVSLLNVSIVAYFVPVIAMILTLIIMNKRVPMRKIPGFDRLSGLMIMICVAFSIVFVLQKTYFGIFFIGGFLQLLVVFAVLLIIIKVAWTRISK